MRIQIYKKYLFLALGAASFCLATNSFAEKGSEAGVSAAKYRDHDKLSPKEMRDAMAFLVVFAQKVNAPDREFRRFLGESLTHPADKKALAGYLGSEKPLNDSKFEAHFAQLWQVRRGRYIHMFALTPERNVYNFDGRRLKFDPKQSFVIQFRNFLASLNSNRKNAQFRALPFSLRLLTNGMIPFAIAENSSTEEDGDVVGRAYTILGATLASGLSNESDKYPTDLTNSNFVKFLKPVGESEDVQCPKATGSRSTMKLNIDGSQIEVTEEIKQAEVGTSIRYSFSNGWPPVELSVRAEKFEKRTQQLSAEFCNPEAEPHQFCEDLFDDRFPSIFSGILLDQLRQQIVEAKRKCNDVLAKYSMKIEDDKIDSFWKKKEKLYKEHSADAKTRTEIEDAFRSYYEAKNSLIVSAS